VLSPAGATYEMRLLLIEDDPGIIYGLKRGLESRGISVDAIGDPKDAVLLFGLGNYDFALLNLVVDSTSGFRIAKELQRMNPKLKFCFISGYPIPKQAFGKEYEKFKDACFLENQTSISDLVEKINQLVTRC
jgi:ActR/RegA family two-component response regulator